jgi:hypothetical protein
MTLPGKRGDGTAEVFVTIAICVRADVAATRNDRRTGSSDVRITSGS